MTKEKTICPVCKVELDEHVDACPRCGFKLLGQTEAFKPVALNENVAKTAKSGPVPALCIEKGPYTGERFILKEHGTFTLGRDPQCDIFLNNMTVSRHHASIEISDSCVKIKDNNSLNGTWVNGSVIDEVVLNVGSHVQIGTFEMLFELIPQTTE